MSYITDFFKIIGRSLIFVYKIIIFLVRKGNFPSFKKIFFSGEFDYMWPEMIGFAFLIVLFSLMHFFNGRNIPA